MKGFPGFEGLFENSRSSANFSNLFLTRSFNGRDRVFKIKLVR
jgi:hypothetical protein